LPAQLAGRKMRRMIQVGEALPDATLWESVEFGDACPLAPAPVAVADAIKGKRIVIFGVPGPFTPTCSSKHVPGYLAQLDALKQRGIDEVWCVAVSDGFVMAAWAKDQGAIGKVRMLGDGNAEFTRKLGLEMDASRGGMGTRCRRFSLLVESGVVKQLNVEQAGKFEVSDADTMLKQIS
jgi:peroxiredoxin